MIVENVQLFNNNFYKLNEMLDFACYNFIYHFSIFYIYPPDLQENDGGANT